MTKARLPTAVLASSSLLLRPFMSLDTVSLFIPTETPLGILITVPVWIYFRKLLPE
jgi:hypothetical protein